MSLNFCSIIQRVVTAWIVLLCCWSCDVSHFGLLCTNRASFHNHLLLPAAQQTTTWFTEHNKFPPQSPDLSTMQHIQGVVEHQLYLMEVQWWICSCQPEPESLRICVTRCFFLIRKNVLFKFKFALKIKCKHARFWSRTEHWWHIKASECFNGRRGSLFAALLK